MNLQLITQTVTQILPKFPNIHTLPPETQNSYIQKLAFLVIDMNKSLKITNKQQLQKLQILICKLIDLPLIALVFKPTIAVAAMLTNEANTHFLSCVIFNNCGIPKGAVEQFEALPDACQREVFEETGLVVDFMGKEWIGVDCSDQVLVVFKASVKIKIKDLQPLSRDEIHGYKTIEIDKLGTGVLHKKYQGIENELKQLAMVKKQSNEEILRKMISNQ